MIAKNELSSLFCNFTEETSNISLDDFYHQIYSAIEQYISQNSKSGKQQCSEYAHILFENAIISNNTNSLLISLIIFDYLNEKPPVLKVDLKNEPIIVKIDQIFDHIHFIISVPDWAPYSDKECMEKIDVAAQSKDNISIIRELQPFYNGPAFETHTKNIAAVIIKWLWTVDRKKIIDFLNENDWSFKMELILFSLKENAKDIIQQTLHSKSRYPAIRSMIFFVSFLEKKDFYEEASNQIWFYCEIIKDFIFSYSTNLKDLRNLLGFLNSKNFNYLAGLCATAYKDFLQEYLPLIKDLSDNDREAFSYGYLKNANERGIANDSRTIMNYWRENCINNHDCINKFNGLEQLLILGLCVGYSSKEEYLMTLKKTAIKIVATQFEWGEYILQKDLYLMFSFTVANKRTKHFFSEDELMQELPILFDKRYEIKFGDYIFDIMRQMLICPNEVQEIIFKDTTNNINRIFKFYA